MIQMDMCMELKEQSSLSFKPKPPYNFDANFHKPSHFPSSDNIWEKGKYWITMIWKNERLGLFFKECGAIEEPEINVTVFSRHKLPKDFIDNLIPEIKWRFNFEQDILEFCRKFHDDRIIGPIIQKWEGMKPVAANSLYETLIIYLVLQNATVRRTVQMLENLFKEYGKNVYYAGKTLSTFWDVKSMSSVKEIELRELKVGYRAKYIKKITEEFVNGGIDEFSLRKMLKEDVKKELLKLYGIGPASIEYLLFEDYYFLDSLETIPPWEQKIMSKLLFGKDLVPVEELLGFFNEGYSGWEKLAFHYIWEDLFWKRKHQKIDWLEKEIRL